MVRLLQFTVSPKWRNGAPLDWLRYSSKWFFGSTSETFQPPILESPIHTWLHKTNRDGIWNDNVPKQQKIQVNTDTLRMITATKCHSRKDVTAHTPKESRGRWSESRIAYLPTKNPSATRQTEATTFVIRKRLGHSNNTNDTASQITSRTNSARQDKRYPIKLCII